MNLFKNKYNQLRNAWWVVIFFLVLGSLTLPMILVSKNYGWEITMFHQALVVVIANWIAQWMRRRPIKELTGVLNVRWISNLIMGAGLGAALMIIPAAFLFMGGWVSWNLTSMTWTSLLNAAGLFMCVAIAEEFLFRGFVFQRLGEGFGYGLAQLIMGGYFLLTHTDNPGMSGETQVLASVNIFLASILFGYTFIKSKSLAMPIGIHFMANFTQGTILGFGVSGNKDVGLFQPAFYNDNSWITGGSFGLEASIPGLVSLLMIFFFAWFLFDQSKKL